VARLGVAALAVAACGGGGAPAPVATCTRPTAALAGVWDDARRAAVAAAFHAVDPRGDDVFARVAVALDRDTARWLDTEVAACELGSGLRPGTSDLGAAQAVAAAARDCLDDYKRELAAVTVELTAATPEIVTHARGAIADLPLLARCSDGDAMAHRPPLPAEPELRGRLVALADRLATARAAALAGKPGDALAIADDVAASSDLAHDPPLAIDAELARAELLTTSGRLDDARSSATRAYDLAHATGDVRAELVAAADIAALAGYDVGRLVDARRWLRSGQAVLAALDGERELEARLAQVEGTVEVVAGNPAAAAPALALAVADDRKLDPDHPGLGAALALLGAAELDLGKVADAERDLRDALAHQRRDLGDDNPDVASAMINLALAQAARGFYADASRSLDDALALQARVLDADHVSRAYAYLARVEVDKGRGDRAAAERDAASAERIARLGYGDSGQLVAQATLAGAELAAETGRGAEAVAKARHARALSAGDDGARVVADATLARALAADGQLRAAIELARDAYARVDAVPRVASATRALVATTLGELLLARGDDAAAIVPLRAAEVAFGEAAPSPWRLVRTRFALARALAAIDPAAALDEAKLALGDAPRDGAPAVRAEIETWIARR
jgi:tetratricopeptide (TPR) repeat protein